ncbi:putative thaumatin [Medicago truncatula]|uniref:Putative thaumatin n=1 Tax=Medicago truncatula TaxID=3880 RepID=A0A396JN26_MEDTR|nr:putative thaumatin [Medicago truncatula]
MALAKPLVVQQISTICVPPELQVTGSDLGVIACKSACMAFNTYQYCCRGDYITEGTCLPTDYSMFFENQCPDAYSYAYDDNSSTFTCSAGPDYTIIFCPSEHLLYPSVTIDGSLFFKCY